MKATFIGGGSLRLLGILRSALAERAIFQDGEIHLHDLNGPRAQAMARMIKKTPEYCDVRCRVTWGTDLAKALAGADMVGVILMAGTAESFDRGADACYRHGFIPSDNVSPNGAFLAVKGAPTLLHIARQMQKYCPTALLVNFANPVAVLSGMLNNHTPIRTIGVCAGYTNHQWDLSRLLGKDEQGDGFDVDVAGVNHLSFILRGTYNGKSLIPLIRRRTSGSWKPPRLQPGMAPFFYQLIPEALRMMVRTLRDLDALIFSTEGDGMMHLQFEAVLAERLKTFKPATAKERRNRLSQAAQKRREADRRFRELLDTDLEDDFWNGSEKRPGLDWAERKDRDIFVEVLRGLTGIKRVKLVSSRLNEGSVAGFNDRTVLEYSQFIDRGQITPAGHYELPASVHGLIGSLAAHQTLLGDALANDDPRLLAQALLCYPVQPYSKSARKLYKTLADINLDQMPRSLQRVNQYL